MKIIPFDIEKAKSGKYKIQTVSGYPVRIICWDRKGTNPHKEYPIVGLINIGGSEREQVFNTDGGIFDSGSSTLDLVLVYENKQAIYDDINFILKNVDVLVMDGHTPTDLAYHNLTLLVMDKVLPKWKRIYKGERLPETSYTKSDLHAQSFMPCAKGTKMGSDCWYLPVTVLDELENEKL